VLAEWAEELDAAEIVLGLQFGAEVKEKEREKECVSSYEDDILQL